MQEEWEAYFEKHPGTRNTQCQAVHVPETAHIFARLIYYTGGFCGIIDSFTFFFCHEIPWDPRSRSRLSHEIRQDQGSSYAFWQGSRGILDLA